MHQIQEKGFVPKQQPFYLSTIKVEVNLCFIPVIKPENQNCQYSCWILKRLQTNKSWVWSLLWTEVENKLRIVVIWVQGYVRDNVGYLPKLFCWVATNLCDDDCDRFIYRRNPYILACDYEIPSAWVRLLSKTKLIDLGAWQIMLNLVEILNRFKCSYLGKYFSRCKMLYKLVTLCQMLLNLSKY